VYRWLDATFGNRNNGPRGGGGAAGPPSGGSRRPDDNRVGEYVDYEEV